MENKDRKFYISALLSILLPGPGQIYNSQLKKRITLLSKPDVIPSIGKAGITVR